MARAKRYPLLIYQHLLGRWSEATFALGVVLFAMGGMLWFNPLGQTETWRPIGLFVTGGIILGFTLFLAIGRHMAYVRLFDTHLRIVTPFMPVNISYKRIRRSYTAEMGTLFGPKKVSSWQKEIVRPFSSRTVIVVELTAFPASPQLLRTFLSPFFFFDSSPHFTFLVEDWMGLSMELESKRIGVRAPRLPAAQSPAPRRSASPARSRSGILSHLPKDDKPGK